MLPSIAEINIYLYNAGNIFPGMRYLLHFLSSTNAWWFLLTPPCCVSSRYNRSTTYSLSVWKPCCFRLFRSEGVGQECAVAITLKNTHPWPLFTGRREAKLPFSYSVCICLVPVSWSAGTGNPFLTHLYKQGMAGNGCGSPRWQNREVRCRTSK